ncbi:MAG: PRC-barrel domain-containing protein [Pseudonocardiaceae bacterium]|nr:PRC-barrel domain-containing protein [Pseudonocardiaceae bacterium]
MIKDDIENLCGLEVLDPHGEKIGTVREVWTDERTGKPAWAYVDTGFLGRHHSFVPLHKAVVVPEHLSVSVPKHLVEDAPPVSPLGDTMEDVEQQALESYYQ